MENRQHIFGFPGKLAGVLLGKGSETISLQILLSESSTYSPAEIPAVPFRSHVSDTPNLTENQTATKCRGLGRVIREYLADANLFRECNHEVHRKLFLVMCQKEIGIDDSACRYHAI